MKTVQDRYARPRLETRTRAKRMSVWGLLDQPLFYRTIQFLLAPGAERDVTNEMRDVVASLGGMCRHLDIGSGPSSYLWRFRLRPVGLDLVHAHNVAFREKGGSAVAGSATELPFADSSFDVVWNFGLSHHLSDEMLFQAIREMLRVVHSEGYVVIFDSVLPEPAWRNPYVWLCCKLDRGPYMRNRSVFLEFLSQHDLRWSIREFKYSLWRYEGILCVCRKSDAKF